MARHSGYKREAVRRTLPRAPKLTKAQIADLRLIKDGADVTGYLLAKRLRQIQRTHPDLLDICEVRGQYDVRDKLPYFGAILTANGRKVIRG